MDVGILHVKFNFEVGGWAHRSLLAMHFFIVPPHSFTEFVPALWDLGIRGYFDTKQCHHFMMEQMQFIHVAVPQHPPHAGSEISPLSAKTKKRL